MSRNQKCGTNWLAVLGVTAAAVVVLWLLFGNKPQPQTNVMAASARAVGQPPIVARPPQHQLQMPSASGPPSSTQPGVVQGSAEPVYTGPQPADLSYEEYKEGDSINYAPLYLMRSNEYLSQANPELAAWDSSHLLPNAALSNCQDGAITDGPTFNQLAVFSGNNLFEASIAERYFTEISPRRIISLADVRPLPTIGTSSSTASFWNQSSLGIQDVAGGLTHYNSAFCAHNQYPSAHISAPTHGAVTPLGGLPVQTSVGSQ